VIFPILGFHVIPESRLLIVLLRVTEDTDSSQQEPITGVQSPQQCEDQFLQTLYEMKEQMKE